MSSHNKSCVDVVYAWCGLPENKTCKFTKDIVYSLRSVKKYIKWIRRIWIIVDDIVTDIDLENGGIDLNDPIIHVVRYKDFIPTKYLPITWNSNVVESWIWKIQELSDKFIYFCDDMYVGKTCTIDMFFYKDFPIVRINRGPPNHSVTVKVKGNDYVDMWQNAITEHNIHYTRLVHNCMPYRKSLMKKYYATYKNEIHAASSNSVRSGKKDFNLLRFSGSLSVMHGDAMLLATDPINVDYFVESSNKKAIANILIIKPQFFCINNTSRKQKWVYDTLEKLF